MKTSQEDNINDNDAPVAEDLEDASTINQAGWSLERVAGLDGNKLCHIKAFYDILLDKIQQRDCAWIPLTKDDYKRWVDFGLYINDGGNLHLSALAANASAYTW